MSTKGFVGIALLVAFVSLFVAVQVQAQIPTPDSPVITDGPWEGMDSPLSPISPLNPLNISPGAWEDMPSPIATPTPNTTDFQGQPAFTVRDETSDVGIVSVKAHGEGWAFLAVAVIVFLAVVSFFIIKRDG